MGKTVKPEAENTKAIEKLEEENLRCLCGRILLYSVKISYAVLIIKCPSCHKSIQYYIGYKVET